MSNENSYLYLKFELKDNSYFSYFDSLKRYFLIKYNSKITYEKSISSIKVKSEYYDELLITIKKDFPLFIPEKRSIPINEIKSLINEGSYLDHTNKLISEKILFKSDTLGNFIESAEFSEAKLLLDQFIKNTISKEIKNVIEVNVPLTVSSDAIIKTGYIDKFTDILILTSGISKEKIIDIKNDKRTLSGENFLSPTVCFRVFPHIREKIKSNLSLTDSTILFTSRAQCFRNEIHVLNTSLRRLNEFSMREYIFVGSQKEITKNIDLFTQIIKKVLEGLFIEKYSIEEANDAFFIGAFRSNSKYQKLLKLKQEFISLVDNYPLSFISINHHKLTMLKAFKILNLIQDKYTDPTSTCIGFGLDRMMLILYSIHGFKNKSLINFLKKLNL
ncbi:hypothetical protein [Prochlorococcus marinus]|uniref:hypothetical protein n=1 Tax=Prochlorococcus marinus TaxID=1219 RepID=UPI001ADA77B8|nr:hypothetical protein [Prochlorococcus marinus]MBO8204969.1 hypothetical protein [Prochlorococcus marinus CUG1415]MBW3044242.1 hypothetical protein [Prochlorococcus marinus str. MU1415]